MKIAEENYKEIIKLQIRISSYQISTAIIMLKKELPQNSVA